MGIKGSSSETIFTNTKFLKQIDDNNNHKLKLFDLKFICFKITITELFWDIFYALQKNGRMNSSWIRSCHFNCTNMQCHQNNFARGSKPHCIDFIYRRIHCDLVWIDYAVLAIIKESVIRRGWSNKQKEIIITPSCCF